MKTGIKILVAGLAVVGLAIAFFLGLNFSNPPPTAKILSIFPVEKIQPSNLAITQAELPSGLGLIDRSERRTIDVTKDALEIGWVKGYQVKYARVGSLLNTTSIEQHISIYPMQNMTKAFELAKKDYSGNERLSDPRIGDRSIAFKRDTVSGRSYTIVFQKKNVHETPHTEWNDHGL
jgi:hypothetical protein